MKLSYGGYSNFESSSITVEIINVCLQINMLGSKPVSFSDAACPSLMAFCTDSYSSTLYRKSDTKSTAVLRLSFGWYVPRIIPFTQETDTSSTVACC